MKNCNNCAWYCHADGKCYGTPARLSGLVQASYPAVSGEFACETWAFDGLEDWEREESVPMAMVVTSSVGRSLAPFGAA